MSSSPTVFISYSSADKQFASDLAYQLQNHDGVRVFFNRDSMELGAPYDEQITTAMRHAQVVVVLLSKHLKNSQFVHHEVTAALKSSTDRTVIPVLLDEQARDNLVWPLVADRMAVGPDLRGVQAAIVSALGRPPHRRWSRFIGPVVAILLASMIALLLFMRKTPPETFKVSVSVEGGAHRGNSPQVGDKLIISATATDLLLVYRDGHLESQCPGDPLCTRTEDRWTVQLRLSAVGTYRILHAAGVGPIVLTRSLDQDLVILDKAAKSLGSSPTVIVH